MSSKIYALVEGRDVAPRPIEDPASAGLTDWWGNYLVENEISKYPITFRDLLAGALPTRTWVPFAVGDGTYLKYKLENAHLPRDLRFIVVATPTSPSDTMPDGWPTDAIAADVKHVQSKAFMKGTPTLFIVGSPALDSQTAFLQMASWEPTSGSLNFYQRDVRFHQRSPELPTWLYLGNSRDAFEPDTRGKGPFDGHVNGTLVMKELSVPWVHWQSMKLSISQTFPPDDPIRHDPLFHPSNKPDSFDYIAGAERLELIVRKAADKWFTIRATRDFGTIQEPKPVVTHVQDWMQHVLDTTTINVSAASVNSEVIIDDEGDFWTPPGMFYDSQALEDVIKSLGSTGFEIPRLGPVISTTYNATIQNKGLALKTLAKWMPEVVAFDHEGQSPWKILVPSLEDFEGYQRVRDTGLLNHKTLASLLMVDFYNPIYSWRRHQLMRHIPSTTKRVGDGYTLSDDLRLAISCTPEAQIKGTPEYEFLENMRLPEDTYDTTFATRVIAYMDKVKTKLATPEGVEQYVLLSESRRRIFRPHPQSGGAETNPLSEFPMTLPYATGLPPTFPFQEMNEMAEVVVMHPKGQALYESTIAQRRQDKLQRFANAQSPCGAFRSSMCPFAGYHMPALDGIRENEPETSNLWDPEHLVDAPGNATWAGAETAKEFSPEAKIASAARVPDKAEPTWDDHVADLFRKPFWIPEGEVRDRVAARWVRSMKEYLIDLGSYESAKPWAVTTYHYLRSRSLPLPGELGDQEYFPKEACELIRLWINQGTRETTNDEIEPREEQLEDVDESQWEIPRVRKDILELTQAELDNYRMKLDDVLHVGDASPGSPWQKLCTIHTEWCPHYQEAFLPWHRAHLLYMESLIDCSIPYWNFFAEGAHEYGNPSAGLPQPFLDETYKHPLTGESRPNPLKYACANSGVSKAFISPGFPPGTLTPAGMKYVQRDPLLTGGGTEAQRREKVSKIKQYNVQILTALSWPTFSQPQGTHEYPWANIPPSDPPPADPQYPHGEDFDGLLEQSQDNFHGWIGPDMADNSYAAFDPVFWSFHANVDRIFDGYLRTHQNSVFSAMSPLQPFVDPAVAGGIGIRLGDPRRHVYTAIGDMTKSSLGLGYAFSPPVHADSMPGVVPVSTVDGGRTPYILFDGVKCTVDSYTIDAFVNCPAEKLGNASVDNEHYVGRQTRTGMGASANKRRCVAKGVTRVLDASATSRTLGIKDDEKVSFSQVVTDVRTGEIVPEKVYKDWEGFVGRLVWGGAMPRAKEGAVNPTG